VGRVFPVPETALRPGPTVVAVGNYRHSAPARGTARLRFRQSCERTRSYRHCWQQLLPAGSAWACRWGPPAAKVKRARAFALAWRCAPDSGTGTSWPRGNTWDYNPVLRTSSCFILFSYIPSKLTRLLLVLGHVLEHGVSVRHLEGVGTRVLRDSAALDEKLLDLHVVEDRAVTPGALAKAPLRIPRAAHAHAARE